MSETHEPFMLVGDRETPVQSWTLNRLGDAMEQLGERQQATYELVGVTRREMGEIRSFLMGDIAPRVTAAEAAKTPAQAAAGHGLKMGQYILVATGALGVVAQVAHLFIPSLEGPIQTVLGIIKGLQ